VRRFNLLSSSITHAHRCQPHLAALHAPLGPRHVVLNGVIGAGIFGLASKVFAVSGSYSLIAFVVCAFCVAAIVLTFAEVASRFSGTGGPYLYASETFGPAVGFAVGPMLRVVQIDDRRL
jgi:amino acid permease